MPLSANDLAKAKRLLLAASVLTEKELGDLLAKDGEYLPALVEAITTEKDGVPALNFAPAYFEEGEDGHSTLETLRAVPESTQDVSEALSAAYYTDPTTHREFMNNLIDELGV